MLASVIKTRTAGALPSSRTEHMVGEALASADIRVVSVELEHVWSHYQSLEFMLNAAANDPSVAVDALNTALEPDGKTVDSLNGAELIELTLRFMGGPVLNAAYENAHSVLPLLNLGVPVPEALREVYGQLDFADPERELSADDLAKFLNEG